MQPPFLCFALPPSIGDQAVALFCLPQRSNCNTADQTSSNNRTKEIGANIPQVDAYNILNIHIMFLEYLRTL